MATRAKRPVAIVVEFVADASRFVRAMVSASRAAADAAAGMRKVAEAMRAAAHDFGDIYDQDAQPVWGAVVSRNPGNQWLANHQARKRNALEARLAGLEARWYVRGGLDPAFASEAARDAQVKALMAERQRGALEPERLAAAFLRGWAEHHAQTEPRPILAFHQRWGSDVAQVAWVVA